MSELREALDRMLRPGRVDTRALAEVLADVAAGYGNDTGLARRRAVLEDGVGAVERYCHRRAVRAGLRLGFAEARDWSGVSADIMFATVNLVLAPLDARQDLLRIQSLQEKILTRAAVRVVDDEFAGILQAVVETAILGVVVADAAPAVTAPARVAA
ncbi:hypothetical protein V6N00_13275 [Tersicoccus sp. MR15.9]|uniref:hypothetical protein n=1 Tax=Tersicoccus mangrovi TaxID=3121635 RepID=UPI002FE56310